MAPAAGSPLSSRTRPDKAAAGSPHPSRARTAKAEHNRYIYRESSPRAYGCGIVGGLRRSSRGGEGSAEETGDHPQHQNSAHLDPIREGGGVHDRLEARHEREAGLGIEPHRLERAPAGRRTRTPSRRREARTPRSGPRARRRDGERPARPLPRSGSADRGRRAARSGGGGSTRGSPSPSSKGRRSASRGASTAKPLKGPASRRGSAKSPEKSAYWVAEKRFSVIRSRSTENAPVPSPPVSSSNAEAPYIQARLPPAPATKK